MNEENKELAVEGFKTETPEPQPIRHRRHFTKAEVLTALCEYLDRNGVTVPQGERYLYGLERAIDRDKDGLTLVIDAEG